MGEDLAHLVEPDGLALFLRFAYHLHLAFFPVNANRMRLM
jgi:hypothetical protein